MLYVGQFEFTLWLAYWYLHSEAFEFEWDQGNHTKSATKHAVHSDDVESVFALKQAVPLGRQISPHTEEERLCVVGPSASGRMISVVHPEGRKSSTD